MIVHLSEKARLIIDMLTNDGFQAFAVGGAVRDNLMGRSADDFDITTSAKPEETKKVFSSFPVIETGIKHGTVTVIIDHTPFEVTTYRSESEYSDSRHPDSVVYVSDIKEDLARRDFTMNAIAYSQYDGLVDPYFGCEDIKNRIIRSVGDPFKRFDEDALRILRALRFSSTLGFKIEKNTSDAICSLAHTLNCISAERIFVELKKLICGKNAQAVISEYISVLKAILPINGDYRSISKLPCDHKMRLYCLFGNAYKEALNKLKSDNETKQICALLNKSKPIPKSETKIKFYLSSLGKENAKKVLNYRKAIFGEDLSDIALNILNSGETLFLSDLAINGNDLVSLGIEGKLIGKMLDTLLIAVIKGEIENTKQSLIDFAINNK